MAEKTDNKEHQDQVDQVDLQSIQVEKKRRRLTTPEQGTRDDPNGK
jgi:urease accessory protein UreE